MFSLENLRKFKIFDFAVIDFVVAFAAMYLLAPLLSKLFLKIGLDIPKQNWLYLTIPISILIHILVGNITPMTKNFLDLRGHYVLKAIVLGLVILGLMGIKIVEKK